MTKIIFKIVGILFVLDLAFFVGVITTAMTDEKPPAIGQQFYWILKYILGFPLVLVNDKFPFFLDSAKMPVFGVILIIVNNIILAFGIYGIRKAMFSIGKN